MSKEYDKIMLDELSLMNQSVYISEDGDSGQGVDELNTDAPTTDAPEVDISTDAPSTDAPTTDMPTTDSISTDAPTTDAPNEIALLRAEIEELKSAKDKDISTDSPSTDAPIEDEDFIGDLDIEDILNDKSKFNNLLNSIYKKGVESAKGINVNGSEEVLKAIPEIVKNNIAIINSLKKASEEFYNNNEDLKPFKKIVANVFEDISANNPDKSYIENLESVGAEVRSRLKLKKDATMNDKKKVPKLPSNRGGKRSKSKPKTSSLVSEIDAMNKSI